MRYQKEAVDIVNKFIACYKISTEGKSKTKTHSLWLTTVDQALQKVRSETIEECAKIAYADGIVGQILAKKMRALEEEPVVILEGGSK